MNTHLAVAVISLPVFILATIEFASAATYYVDSSLGNDHWSGLRDAPSGSPASDGPWQSLARVTAKSLTAGDSVLLKCGGSWHETLTLQSSGTAASPITIGTYPSACTNKPIINGADAIPAHNWTLDSGNIYKLASGIDLVSFGSFEQGLGKWTPWSPNSDASMALIPNCAATGDTCLSFTGGTANSILSSNNFGLPGQKSHTASFKFKAPAGVTVRVVVRRAASPWDAVGLSTSVTGTGNWQTATLPFTATATLANARIDFVVPAKTPVLLDNVKVTAALSDALGVFDSGQAINIAHYPNQGYNAQKPASLFYAIAENADSASLPNGGTGSTYLTTGPDLASWALAAIKPGTGVRIRTNAFTLADHKIKSVSGARLYFDTPTTYPVKKDWGYFLYGQRWMLDQPGEWHYDPATKILYVWMGDSGAPGSRVSVGQRSAGIVASGLSHVRIENLAIQNVDTAVRMDRTTNTVLRNMHIRDTLGFGVDALYSTDSGVENSEILRTQGDALSTGGFGTRFHAYDNLIRDSAVRYKNGGISSLPEPSRAAIHAGRSATVRGNRIYGAAYIGIRPHDNSLVSGNHIENACLVLDDCGGIYTNGQNNNSTFENNTIRHLPGGMPGKPAGLPSLAQGIYLDDLTSGVTVRGNTVVDTDNGIQLHNAANNLLENNTLYENRRHQIWIQERTQRLDAEGDAHGNLVLGNRLFATAADRTAVGQTTELNKDNTDRFAAYDRNMYFTLLSPTISTEAWAGGGASYTLPTWQAAVTTASQPRTLDAAASEVNGASFGYALFHTLGGNILPNGNLAKGLTGWEAWNQTAPYGQLLLESCTPASQCLRYTAGASVSLLSSPNFSVKQGQWYKMSFDIKTGIEGQLVTTVARRGGGGSNGYESLMETRATLKGTTNWRRHSFTFKATKTVNANDPVTLDRGARVDFERIAAGQSIAVANLEMVPISAVDTTLRSRILVNPSSTALAVGCPDGDAAAWCNDYVRFSDSVPVSWPHTLPPNGSEIIYTRDSKLTDGDGDGIPDYQDICAGTGPTLAVNAAGCALGQ